MATIFALIGLLAPLPPVAAGQNQVATHRDGSSIDGTMRYRGIDRLFEKFSATGD